MVQNPSRLPGQTQRTALYAALVLVECAVWVNTADSAIAKGPLMVAGAAVTAAFLAAGCIVRGKCTLPAPGVQFLVFLHVPLFALSAIAFSNPVYTPGALAFGIASCVYFFAGSLLFPTKEGVESFLTLLARLTFLLCLTGAVQALSGDLLPLDFHGGAGRRVGSLLGNAEYFGTFLAAATPCMIARALILRGTGRFPSLRWILPAVMVALIFATRSRSAWFGALASLIVFAFLVSSGRTVRKGIIAAGGLAFLFALTVTVIRPDIGERIWASAGIQRESSMARRAYFWKGGLAAFLDSPVSGYGIGAYEKMLFRYRSPDYWTTGGEDIVPHAHNEIVEIAVEYGLIGLILCAVTVTSVLWKGIRTARNGEGRVRLVSAALVAGIAGGAVDGMASVSLRQPPVALFIWLCMGLLVSPALSGRRDRLFSVRLLIPERAALVPAALCVIGVSVIALRAIHSIRSDTHIFRGALTSEGRSPGRAMEYLEAVEEAPLNLRARSNLVLAFLDAGRWKDALDASDELRLISPDYPKNHLMRAYALLRLDRPAEALEEIRAELGRRSHPEAYLIESAICRRLGDARGERTALTGMLRADLSGGVPYGLPEGIARLAAQGPGAAGSGEAAALLDSIRLKFGDPALAGSEHRDGN